MIIPEDASDVLTVSFNDYEESYSVINESGYESFCGQEYSGESNLYFLQIGCKNHTGMFY